MDSVGDWNCRQQERGCPVTILPVTQDGTEGAWTVEEYFGLYPQIRLYDDGWLVIDPRDNERWSLKRLASHIDRLQKPSTDSKQHGNLRARAECASLRISAISAELTK